MDEKAMIFRICVWLSPIQPPRPMDMIAMAVSSVGLSECDVRSRIVVGGSFISVERSRAVVREDPCNTSGNQKWNGVRPSLMAMAVVSSRHDGGWVSWVMSHCPVAHALVMLENRTSVEAAACTRKYLVVASIARGWWDFEIRGMIARVLISSPVQAMAQWLLVIVIVVPSRRLVVEMSFARGLISRGRS